MTYLSEQSAKTGLNEWNFSFWRSQRSLFVIHNDIIFKFEEIGSATNHCELRFQPDLLKLSPGSFCTKRCTLNFEQGWSTCLTRTDIVCVGWSRRVVERDSSHMLTSISGKWKQSLPKLSQNKNKKIEWGIPWPAIPWQRASRGVVSRNRLQRARTTYKLHVTGPCRFF